MEGTMTIAVTRNLLLWCTVRPFAVHPLLHPFGPCKGTGRGNTGFLRERARTFFQGLHQPPGPFLGAGDDDQVNRHASTRWARGWEAR